MSNQTLAQQTIKDLQAIVGIGNSRTYPNDLKEFGKDWTTNYTPNPSLALLPAKTSEVSAIVKYCAKHNIKLVPSGGRTGLAGGAAATAGEVVISMQRMNKIIAVNRKSLYAEVEAGVTTHALQVSAAKHGLIFALDMASKGSACIGGNIATNAGGTHFVRYGGMREQVLGLEIVAADGNIMQLNGALHKNNTGYALQHLLIGSEGTLGIITKAIVKLVTKPLNLTTVFLAIDKIPSVLKILEILQLHAGVNISVFEIIDASSLDAVTRILRLQPLFSKPCRFAVLLELDGIEERIESVLNSIFDLQLANEVLLAQSKSERQKFWHYREGITEALSTYKYVYKGDVAVPVAQLTLFVDAIVEDFYKYAHDDIEMMIFGHVGDGNLHINYVSNVPERQVLLQNIDRRMHQLVADFAGSISAEHGIGLRKKDYLPFSRSAEEIAMMCKIKLALDPQAILNPHKIFDL